MKTSFSAFAHLLAVCISKEKNLNHGTANIERKGETYLQAKLKK